MAIYHFSVTVLSRARGHRIVGSAAVQAAESLRDEYYGMLHNHERRPGVEFKEILAPQGAPSWATDREQLWNQVEAAEHRKDAQLARAIDIGLPAELSPSQRMELLRDFVNLEFVRNGMVADVAIRRSTLGYPNAHILLTLRTATATGFGPKRRDWNGKANLLGWRASWANRANLHFARAGLRLRIDHRTLDEQEIELSPARKTGIGRPLRDAEELPEHLAARMAEQSRIAHANGLAIIEDPAVAIRALAQQSAEFTLQDISRFLDSRTDGIEQHDAALKRVLTSSELLESSAEGGHPTRFTSRALNEAQASLTRRARTLANRRPQTSNTATPLAESDLPSASSRTLREALALATSAGDFKAVAMSEQEVPGLLKAIHAYWAAQGRRVLESVPRAKEDRLVREDVLVITGAEMIHVKTLERIFAAAERARAKLVLVADLAQLRAMGAMSPMSEFIALDGEQD